MTDLSFRIVEEAVIDSFESRVHVYDYLVAYPLKGVDKVILADDAFSACPLYENGGGR